MLTSSLQDLLQNQSLEIILICIVVLCFPHNSTACTHMCDECKESNVLNVSCMLSSTSSWHGQACSLPIKYQVCQFEPNTHFRTNCEQTEDYSPTDPISSSFELMVVNTWSRDFAQLLSGFVCKFEITFHAFLRMTFQMIRPT